MCEKSRSLRTPTALLIVGAMMAVLNAFAAPEDKSLGDIAITARIETIFLMNGDLNPFKINTSTTDGVVTLTGVVQDNVDKDLAGKLAKTVHGVKEVHNELTIQRDIQAVKEHTDWRQEVDDAALNARIRRQLAYNAGTKSAILDIDVNGSTVVVNGEVESAEKKKAIERIIDETSGVSRVDSKLVVVEKNTGTEADAKDKSTIASKADNAVETLSDEWVEKMVESSIMWNENLGINQIDVEVDQGICTLTGSLLSESQKKLAESIAKSTDGVKSVNNNITVSKFSEG